MLSYSYIMENVVGITRFSNLATLSIKELAILFALKQCIASNLEP